jgi:DNA polymerase-3 subunit delta
MPSITFKTLSQYIDDPQRKRFEPVHLLFGEEFLRQKALEALLDKMLPDAQNRMNYETVDGDNENIPLVVERISTYSLLSGDKILVINDSKIFFSTQNQEIFLVKAKEAFDNDNLKKASRYFVALLGNFKFSFDDVQKENRNKTLKTDLAVLSNDAWVDAILDYCRDNDVAIPKIENRADSLQRVIEKGFPSQNHLIITADIVDKRRSLFKIIKKQGMIIDCSAPKGIGWADRKEQEAIIRERMQARLSQSGKNIDMPAFKALYDMTGFDLRTFTGHLDKLIHFIGNRKRITAKDVQAVAKRTKSDPIFTLTDAVARRNLAESLFLIKSLSDEGLHPLQMLTAMVNQIRKLLLVKGFTESSYNQTWKGNATFDMFKNQVMPAVRAYDKEIAAQLKQWEISLTPEPQKAPQAATKTKKKKKTKRKTKKTGSDFQIAPNPNNPYPVYQSFIKAENFTKDELIDTMDALSQADLQLKSSGHSDKRILEQLLFSICRTKSTQSHS